MKSDDNAKFGRAHLGKPAPKLPVKRPLQTPAQSGHAQTVEVKHVTGPGDNIKNSWAKLPKIPVDHGAVPDHVSAREIDRHMSVAIPLGDKANPGAIDPKMSGDEKDALPSDFKK
jgi:hypothetical protein